MCVGVNANDITHRVVETGQFYKSDVMLKTLSDAINIQVVRKARMIEAFVRVALFWCGFDRHVIILLSFHISFSFGRANGWLNKPYNFERLLFYLSNGNHKLINELYAAMEATSQMDIPKELHERLQAEFQSAVVKDDELCRILRVSFP